MAIQPEQPTHSLLLDALYCEEDKWADEEEEQQQRVDDNFLPHSSVTNSYNLAKQMESPFFCQTIPSLLEHDMIFEDEELASLFFKEQEQHRQHVLGALDKDLSLSNARGAAVDWMLKVVPRCGFSALTGILGLNYLDRFLVSFCYQKDQPWMIQIAAVACLSLAAKVEETRAPLLVELQEVVKSDYLFRAKDIQSMELLVLSTLKWKMHPVTPLSFIDHIVRRLGFRSHFHREFLGRCERLLLYLLSDSRSVVYLPSVLATATMMHVIDQVEPFKSIEYQNQLLGVLEMNQDEVNGCYQLIQELLPITRTTTTGNNQQRCTSLAGDQSSLKRKHDQLQLPATARSRRSPSGVIDAVLCCDSSNDSWALGGDVDIGSSVPLSSSPHEKPLFKRSRTQDELLSVGIVGTTKSRSRSPSC